MTQISLQENVTRPSRSETHLEETGDTTLRWRGLLVAGVFVIGAGVAAILLPRLAALTVELVLGVLLVFDGLLQGVHAFQLRRRPGFEWKLFSALAAFGIGMVLLVFPLSGVITLSLLIGAFFVVSGALKILLAYQMRDLSGSGWLLFVGILSLAAGASVLFLWPEIAASLIGVLVGIDFILGGTWLIALALSVRRTISPR